MRILLFIFINIGYILALQDFNQPRSFVKQFIKKKEVDLKPIVLVPGILGSRLYAKLNKTTSKNSYCYLKSDWFLLWLNLPEILPRIVNCWVDNIRLFHTGKNQYENNEGVKVEAKKFGSTEYVEYIDDDKYAPGSSYFAPLAKYLVNQLGYVRDKTLFGAPYDWRLGVEQSQKFLKNLTKLIEEVSSKNQNKKVVIISHSMGNLHTYYWLRHLPSEWKDKYIESFVSIAGPYLGAAKSLKALISGDTEGHPWVLPVKQLRAAFRTMPSSAMLLPRPDLWPDHKKDIVGIQMKDGTMKNLTVFDYKTILEKANCPDCYQMWLENNMTVGHLEAPDVPVHCVYSTQIKTAEVGIYLFYFNLL